MYPYPYYARFSRLQLPHPVYIALYAYYCRVLWLRLLMTYGVSFGSWKVVWSYMSSV